MNNAIYIDWDYSLAAVKFRGQWRFFYDVETMFILDYSAYSDFYQGYRDGILLVNEDNAERWMKALAGELTPEQLSHTYWANTSDRVRLTFVIDFDEKVWVGYMWKMDQSPLADYQPADWLALEDDLTAYLPPEIPLLFQ